MNVTVEQIAEALGIENEEIDCNYSIEIINAGLRTLIVPIRSLEQEISMYPDEKILKSFCLSNDIDIILIFSKETGSDDYIAHTRVFAPRFGYLEDPATGSGNSAFANYLLKNNLWNGETAVIEQGGDNIAYNPVYIKKNGKDVLFGGKATVVIDGVYHMNE